MAEITVVYTIGDYEQWLTDQPWLPGSPRLIEAMWQLHQVEQADSEALAAAIRELGKEIPAVESD